MTLHVLHFFPEVVIMKCGHTFGREEGDTGNRTE